MSERLSWDEYFSKIVETTSERSPCSRLQVGCLLVNDNRIVSQGYNGFLPGCPHKSIVRDNHEQATLHAEQNALMRWHQVPKFHYFAHWGLEMNSRWNPKFAWCYGDEDLMGILKQIGASCSAGTAYYGMLPKILEKIVVALSVRWAQ